MSSSNLKRTRKWIIFWLGRAALSSCAAIHTPFTNKNLFLMYFYFVTSNYSFMHCVHRMSCPLCLVVNSSFTCKYYICQKGIYLLYIIVETFRNYLIMFNSQLHTLCKDLKTSNCSPQFVEVSEYCLPSWKHFTASLLPFTASEFTYTH